MRTSTTANSPLLDCGREADSSIRPLLLRVHEAGCLQRYGRRTAQCSAVSPNIGVESTGTYSWVAVSLGLGCALGLQRPTLSFFSSRLTLSSSPISADRRRRSAPCKRGRARWLV